MRLTVRRVTVGRMRFQRPDLPLTERGVKLARSLADASQVAERLGEGHNEYNTEFSPANVQLYEIAVAVELGDAGRALRAATVVDSSGLSAERQAQMLIDVARAHTQRRQVGEAVAVLLQAEAITPEQVRSHALVRQLVSDLFTMQDPPAAELRDLARRLTATT